MEYRRGISDINQMFIWDQHGIWYIDMVLHNIDMVICHAR